MPDKVISSILSLLQWYIARYLWWEVGFKERACSFTCLLVEVGEHVCMHCLNWCLQLWNQQNTHYFQTKKILRFSFKVSIGLCWILKAGPKTLNHMYYLPITLLLTRWLLLYTVTPTIHRWLLLYTVGTGTWPIAESSFSFVYWEKANEFCSYLPCVMVCGWEMGLSKSRVWTGTD